MFRRLSLLFRPPSIPALLLLFHNFIIFTSCVFLLIILSDSFRAEFTHSPLTGRRRTRHPFFFFFQLVEGRVSVYKMPSANSSKVGVMTKKPDQGSALTSTARVSDRPFPSSVGCSRPPEKFHRDNKKKGKVVGMDEIHSPFDLTAGGNTITWAWGEEQLDAKDREKENRRGKKSVSSS